MTVEGEDHWLIGREDGIEIPIGKTVRMLGTWLECHEIDYVHDPDSQIGEMGPQDDAATIEFCEQLSGLRVA